MAVGSHTTQSRKADVESPSPLTLTVSSWSSVGVQYGSGLFSSGGGASLQSLLDASSPNGGSYSRNLGSEKCLLCNRPRDEEVFLCCRKCGSSYHGRCVQADEAVEPLCGICGETLTPAGPPVLPPDVAKVRGRD